jgi:hypothetical protein
MNPIEELTTKLSNTEVGDKNRNGDNTTCFTSSDVEQGRPLEEPQQSNHVAWDWTEALPDSEHVNFLKSVEWANTPLGPMENWPPVLRQATYQVIADSRPATLYWLG